jgi:HEAT repeat protein
MSTLDAILQDNKNAQQPIENISEPEKTEINEELEEFKQLNAEQNAQAEDLFTNKQFVVADDVRYLSARILGDCQDDEAIDALLAVMTDDDAILRQEAALSLGHIAEKYSNPRLIKAQGVLATHLHLGDNTMRLACVRALGELGDNDAISILFEYINDKDNSVIIQIINSLTKLLLANKKSQEKYDDILEKFVELLKSDNISIRKAVATSLAQLKYDKSVDAIIDAAFLSGGHQARDMAKSLSILGADYSIDKLLELMDKTPDSSHRRFVIEMLEEITLSA